jgi:NTE family protein
LEGQVALPTVSPYAYPDVAHAGFRDLLTAQVDVDRLARLQESPPEDQPLLLIGAADVLSGDFKAFSSRRREVTVNAVLASAAVPLLFRAVEERGRYYWDGLFSQNPPVRELPDAGPEEIWVVRINPRGRSTEPTTVGAIADRRNELAGNLSLEQELYFIRKVNEWADRLGNGYRHIEIREISMDLDLDLASKLDRSPAFLRRLFDTGREQADRFLAGLPG